ncbi:uncharacterized protein DS421_5g138070 [Arachis hypogaea]|nr:uncharacterized protein DS421_5g138070 [Arachis hypogaea]
MLKKKEKIETRKIDDNGDLEEKKGDATMANSKTEKGREGLEEGEEERQIWRQQRQRATTTVMK